MTLDRRLEEAKEVLGRSIEIENLAVSQANFVGVMETLIQKLHLSDEGTTRLQELTINGLSNGLLFDDLNLAERFGRGARFLNNLCIANVRWTRPETKVALAHMIKTILSG